MTENDYDYYQTKRKDTQMKAILSMKYGSPEVLQLKEIDKPAPNDNEVLVKVYTASVNAGDWHLLRGKPSLMRLMGFGFLKPKNTILGSDIAGQVEAVGKNVKQFKPGDEVFGNVSTCGWGGFAEYVCATEDALVLKPTRLTFAQAAAVPMAAITALQGLRNKGKIQSGQKVLVNGASGGVGTFAVQIAKAFGAEVTAVCSTRNIEVARSIGADHVIDYTKEDFTKTGQHYDLILSANGYHSISDYKRALNPKGIYVMSGGTTAAMLHAIFIGPWVAKPNKNDLLLLQELLEKGKIVPAIDRCYPLSEVAEAIRYLEEGHAKGKVIISIVTA